jgi:hypothetical protein
MEALGATSRILAYPVGGPAGIVQFARYLASKALGERCLVCGKRLKNRLVGIDLVADEKGQVRLRPKSSD